MKQILFVLAAAANLLVGCGDKNKDELAGGGARPDGTYFKLTVNGQPKELSAIHYARAGKTVHFATYAEDGGLPNLNITLTTTTEDDFRGTYQYHMDNRPGTCIILYGIGESNGYESHWWDCPSDGPLLVSSPGNLKIENIERPGSDEFVTGSFNVVQYQPQGNCPYAEVKEIKITGEFRLKRAK